MSYLYSKKNNKPRADVNRHTFTPTTQVPEPSERAGSGFFNTKNQNSDKGLARNLTLYESAYEETDDFLEQCIHEWAQWLITQELKQAQRTFKKKQPFSITDWSTFHSISTGKHKEATTD